MSCVGIVSNDVVTKNRICDELRGRGHEVIYVHSAANFDPHEFDVIFVDLESPQAMLILKSQSRKCIGFGPANSQDEKERHQMAQGFGCDRVYKPGEFFKKVLPGWS